MMATVVNVRAYFCVKFIRKKEEKEEKKEVLFL